MTVLNNIGKHKECGGDIWAMYNQETKGMDYTCQKCQEKVDGSKVEFTKGAFKDMARIRQLHNSF